MRLAICMIVKNESSCLERCLESIKGLGDIYIVDTGSTDNTCEIARKYTEHVYENEYKWNDSFCEARNYVLNKAKADWILSIDADNVLEDGGQAKILKAIEHAEKNGYKTIEVILQHDASGSTHTFPNIFKRADCYWKGAIHNYISVSESNKSDIVIRYGYSEAHKLDPDRSFRILGKEVEKPGAVRELYYYAREYWYRREFEKAIEWYGKYLTVATWPKEIADAYMMVAKCCFRLKRYNDARVSCLMAININCDFKEALQMMADLTGPINSERWLNWAYSAQNREVLFVNTIGEKNDKYYNELYKYDTPERYSELYRTAVSMLYDIPFYTGDTMPCIAMDIGCGVGELSKYINSKEISHQLSYAGIDFSDEAIKLAKQKGLNVAVADLYKYEYTNECIYFILEVLEHIDDIKLLKRLPKGSIVIASVPSFGDRAHLRRYTKDIVAERYKDIIDISFIKRFNWDGSKWKLDGNITTNHITLFGGIIK